MHTLQTAQTAHGKPQQAPLKTPLDQSIHEIGLPYRIEAALDRNRIRRVGDLIRLKAEDVLKFHDFGKGSLRTCKKRLEELGFKVSWEN
ncbi:MAG TPA: DNA-directed RNA polymerase subunit alpha C-terminal domain-containing protein [Candidatus Paceibacterota bacterium]|jgi:DNA-directed RNA polymerase alpha subunit|nr:DNA-directed RNA polymerase subunit alpha C-terminal domain-containing protein [Candidatus Paceibacterota bacterium]